ncbi:MAG: FkbM family methyltransferase [Pseudomonadota bacterium]
MKCAVIVPIASGQQDFFDACVQSVEDAWVRGSGPFTAYDTIPIWDTTDAMSLAERHNLGIDIAKTRACDWLFFLNVIDLMNVGAFADMENYHAERDAVWGNIAINLLGSPDVQLMPAQPTVATRIEDVLRYLPERSVSLAHFVRTGVADAVRFDTGLALGADHKYLLDLWEHHVCEKVARVFAIERRAQKPAPNAVGGENWTKAVETIVLERIKGRDIVCDVTFDNKTSYFMMDNPFDIIQFCHGRGTFFEIKELQVLQSIVGMGKTIVEVGANIGNHLVFYAQHLEAKKIFPFEPNPVAVALLDKNIHANKLEAVIDKRGIGIGAGAEYGKFSVMLPGENNLGAARLEAGSGELEVFPLDETLKGEQVDFMKIDVEGMEFDVLQGAKGIIGRDKPTLMVEVFRPKIPQFEAWCADNNYRVVMTFPCVNAVNFVAKAA